MGKPGYYIWVEENEQITSQGRGVCHSRDTQLGKRLQVAIENGHVQLILLFSFVFNGHVQLMFPLAW